MLIYTFITTVRNNNYNIRNNNYNIRNSLYN